MRRHLIRLAQAPFISSVWQRLVRFGFHVQRVRSTMQNLRRMGENPNPILSRLWNQSLLYFQTLYEAPCTFQRPIPIAGVTGDLVPITCRSLVEFRLLISVCEAGQ